MDEQKSLWESLPSCEVPSIWPILTRNMTPEEMNKAWSPSEIAVLGMFTAFVFPKDTGNAWHLYWRIPNGLYIEADPVLMEAHGEDKELELIEWEI